MLKKPYALLVLTLFVLIPQKTTATELNQDDLFQSISRIINEHIREAYDFYGLATYYHKIDYFLVSPESMVEIKDDTNLTLEQDQWLVIAGRFNVLIINSPGVSLLLDKSSLKFDNSEKLVLSDSVVKITIKSELSSIAPELGQIRYAHLWSPLAWLAKIVEQTLNLIQSYVVNNWGWAIVIFSVLLKIILLPVAIMTVRFQREVSLIQAKLSPKLAEIKNKNYTAEQTHHYLMAAHKEMGVSTFYALKPILGSFIQVPILIAVFNALGEMPQLDNQSFLWIENLAYPDTVGSLPFSIPMFGNTISLLPFVMTIVTVFSTIIYSNHYAPERETKRQKRNLHLMAIAFFVLFYPFPAAMVLYWALANVLQTIQQQIIKI